ncbi:MAG: MaoC family dehydratase N-terminal domain-containing protein [Actinomycetota bacterium]
MPLNRDLIGKEYEETSFFVERDRIVQFADAIGDADPRYRSEDPIAPPTFPTVIQIASGGQVALDPELGLDYSRVVHGEQEYVADRPLRAGDRIIAKPRIADIYARGPNEFLVVETDYADPSGSTICTGRSTLISRGTAR